MKEEIQLPENDNFSKLCRACLSSGDLRSLLDYGELLVTFKHLTYLQIGECDDKLPQNICSNCIVKIEDISEFISLCKASDAYLRKQLLEKDIKKKICETLIVDDCCDKTFNETKDTSAVDSKPEIQILDSTKKNEKVTKPLRTIPKRKRSEECSCDTCGKKFSRLGGLQRHMRIHSGIKPYKCKTCNKTFAQKATLERHHLTHTGEKPFECNLCGKAARRRDQVIEHIQKHHSNVTDPDSVITEHERTNTASPETDNEQEANSESKVLENEETHSEVNEVKCKTKKRIEICLCNLCGKVFQRRGYLKNHMAIHAKVKPFICNICGRGFTQRHSLTRHNLVHTKERPFQCNFCGKTFTRKEILTEHIKNHDGATPYLCFHCGKYFSNKDYLKKHLNYYLTGNKGKRKSGDDKKCTCSFCGKQLHSVSYLKTHLLMHSGEKPFQCKICGNKFTVQRSLKHHLNIHDGIKPYQCTQCDKAFRTSSSLRKHTLLHTGERPYKCTSCDKGFIRRSHLKRHFRTH